MNGLVIVVTPVVTVLVVQLVCEQEVMVITVVEITVEVLVALL